MGFFINLLLTAILTVLFIPGLVIEPGPISEIAYLGLVASIWGLDWSGGQDGGGSS